MLEVACTFSTIIVFIVLLRYEYNTYKSSTAADRRALDLPSAAAFGGTDFDIVYKRTNEYYYSCQFLRKT